MAILLFPSLIAPVADLVRYLLLVVWQNYEPDGKKTIERFPPFKSQRMAPLRQ